MIRLEANRDTCSGYGNCVVAAETIFDLDDDGLVVLKQAVVGDDQLRAARQAAYDCPTDSITVVQEDDSGAAH
jgi:ferredoxin